MHYFLQHVLPKGLSTQGPLLWALICAASCVLADFSVKDESESVFVQSKTFRAWLIDQLLFLSSAARDFGTQLCYNKLTQPEMCSVLTAGLMPDHVDWHLGEFEWDC